MLGSLLCFSFPLELWTTRVLDALAGPKLNFFSLVPEIAKAQPASVSDVTLCVASQALRLCHKIGIFPEEKCIV